MKRVVQFDFLRAVCMLYIVGLWHLNNYLSPSCTFSGRLLLFLEYVTISVLATFTFMSGYMMRKYEFRSSMDVLFFYKKRMLRFWPLFFLSAVSLLVMRWMDASQFLFGITGLALFTSAPLKTLWYISMLMFLYMITPLIRYNNNSGVLQRKRYLFVASTFLIVIIVLVVTKLADQRLLRYSTLYVAGLFCKDVTFSRIKWIWILFGSVVLLVLTIIYLGFVPVVQKIFIAFFGCSFIVSLGFLIPIIPRLEIIISFFAYGSMTAYLFHRQLFGIAVWLFGQATNIHYLPLWLAISVLFVVFGCSWLIQIGYDKVLNHIVKDKT